MFFLFFSKNTEYFVSFTHAEIDFAGFIIQFLVTDCIANFRSLNKITFSFSKKTASLIWMKQNICFLIQFMLICHRKSETKKCYYFCFSSKKSQMFPKSAYKQWHKNNGNFALVLVSSVNFFENN